MPDHPATDDASPPKTAPEPAEVEQVHNKGAFDQRTTRDKLASDRVGEELKPDACIWRLYAEEAKEYDTEMAQERNKNLDTMLLFATLFSAIVTAFIIESTNLLEQDSSEVSTQLLLMLVQSQQRLTTGMADPTPSDVEIPAFTPSATARLINVLWFASLMISLGAAVIAILAKEWLSAFISYRTRHAHEYALQRQARLASLDTWNMLPIIDLLPTLLNCTLFVFSLGLIIRLWLLDFVVAVAITIISAAVCGIYLFFVISGAVHEACPYKARLSTYIQRSIPKYFTQIKSTSLYTPNYIKQEEINLLTWLLNNSSDPALGSYVTQALAGLRSLRLGLPTFLNKEVTIPKLHGMYQKNTKVLSPLLDLGAQAIDQLRMAPIRGRNELASSGGSSVARLAIALSEIYPHALTWQLCATKDVFQPQGETPGETAQAQGNYPTEVQGSTSKKISEDKSPEQAMRDNALVMATNNAHKITEGVFDALDLVWAETSPALTPSAYAYLATAELKMLRHALAFPSPRTETKLPASPDHNSIEIDPIHVQAKLPSLDQDNLQACYSRALSRTALVIKSSLHHLISKGSQELQSAIVDLLLEATELVKQEKPKSSNTSHRFGTAPSSRTLNEEISITITTENGTMRRVTCRTLARNLELMESLVELCGSDTSMDTLRLESFRVAAFNLLLVFWPAYLQQWKIDEGNESGFFPWQLQEWDMVPFQATHYNSQTSAEIIIYQSIVLTYVATWLWKGPESNWLWKDRYELNLFQLVLRVLFSGSSTLPKITKKLGDNTLDRFPIYRQWLPTNGILEKWIYAISHWYVSDLLRQFIIDDETSRRLSWCIACLIAMTKTLAGPSVDIFSRSQLIQSGAQHGNATPEDPGNGVDGAMAFIYAASQATDRDTATPVIGDLLGQLATYIKEAPPPYDACLSNFTNGQGFYILTKIGLVKSDHEAVVDVVLAVLRKLYAVQLQVDKEVVPLLFEAMGYVCDVGENYPSTFFVGDALFQLRRPSSDVVDMVTRDTSSSVQKVLDKLGYWDGKAAQTQFIGATRDYQDEIVALRRLVQQRIDHLSGGSSPAANGFDPLLQHSNNPALSLGTSNYVDGAQPIPPPMAFPEPQIHPPSLGPVNGFNNQTISSQNPISHWDPWNDANAALSPPRPPSPLRTYLEHPADNAVSSWDPWSDGDKAPYSQGSASPALAFPEPQINTTGSGPSDVVNNPVQAFERPISPWGHLNYTGGAPYHQQSALPTPPLSEPQTHTNNLGPAGNLNNPSQNFQHLTPPWVSSGYADGTQSGSPAPSFPEPQFDMTNSGPGDATNNPAQAFPPATSPWRHMNFAGGAPYHQQPALATPPVSEIRSHATNLGPANEFNSFPNPQDHIGVPPYRQPDPPTLFHSDPQANTFSSAWRNEALRSRQSSFASVVPSFRNLTSSDSAASLSDTDDGLSSSPSEASGSDRARLTPPPEFVALPESADEDSDEESMNESEEN